MAVRTTHKGGGGGGGREDIKTRTLTMVKEAELSIYSLIKLLPTAELGCPTVKYHIRKPKGGGERGAEGAGGWGRGRALAVGKNTETAYLIGRLASLLSSLQPSRYASSS